MLGHEAAQELRTEAEVGRHLEIELAKLKKFLPNVSFPFAFELGVLVLDVCFSHYQ